jgi:xylulokinase
VATLIGVDVGTTGVRAVAVGEGGELLASETESYPLSMPRPRWTEQDPGQWWEGTRKVLGRVAAKVGDVAGLGLTGQMHGSVFLDREDRVIRPALLWNDQRTDAQCEEITRRVGAARLLEIAGNPALTGFQAPKILWLRDEEPDNFDRLARVLLPKDYIRLRLTGELGTDVSDASGTLLLDVRRRTWSPELLEALHLSSDLLPPVFEGSEITGTVSDGVADELGLPRGLPVAAGGGDNAAAAVGIGVVEKGLASSSIGTSGVLFAHTAEFTPDQSGRIHAFGHAVTGAYHVMGVTLAAGASLAWWRDVAAAGADFSALADSAAKAPVGAEGLLFLPYLSGERSPHLDPHARGAFVGLTARHDRAHLTRAVMEGVVFSLRDCFEIVRDLGVPVDQMRAIGGGARHPLWLQLQADIYGVPVTKVAVDEGPAYGAALLAGIGSGRLGGFADAAQLVRTLGVIEPDEQRKQRYDELFVLYRELYRPLSPHMRRLSEISTSGTAP